MASLKSLAKDTAVYGLSSIIGRFLNWCLVPLYTVKFAAAQYGVVTYVYSVVALALIVLTYGMETGFFRFTSHERYRDDPMRVYSTSLISLGVSSAAFIALTLLFIRPVSGALQCAAHEGYIAMMAAAVGIDAFTAIPFSYLRYRRRAVRFALLKLTGIGLNIGLNLWWILISPWLLGTEPSIGYIFLANLISSAAMLPLMVSELRGFRWRFDATLWRAMIAYSWPLLVLGIAGIMNQTIDKIIFPLLAADRPDAMAELGIYGANYKIAIVMVMFIQAFRFAYEPFIFAQSREQGVDRLDTYARAMKYFVIFAMVIFMAVMFYLDLIKYFISPRYFSGLKVVPVIMTAEFFFGVFFNLSLWYKLTDKTMWGMWFSLLGLAVTLALNILLVPRMSYMGCALAALGCYGVMMLASYFTGRRRLPVPYQTGRLMLYFASAIALWALTAVTATGRTAIDLSWRTLLLAAWIGAVARIEHLSPRTLIPRRHRPQPPIPDKP